MFILFFFKRGGLKRMVNKKERFVNVNEHIYQYGEWYCSAKGEHCADVIATALNMYDELEKEHEKLEQEFKDRIKYTHQLEVELKKLEAKHDIESAINRCKNLDALLCEIEDGIHLLVIE